MKTKLMALLAAIAAAFGAWGAPTVTDITAKQRYPWNGLVDIYCKVSGIEAGAGRYEFIIVAVNKDTGKKYTVSNYSIKHGGEDATGLDVCENGDYSFLWNAREDLGQVVVERMIVRITLEGIASSVGKVQLWEGGPYWADRNIGAKKPEDSGLYFWWGDTVGHNLSSDGKFDFYFEYSDFTNCPTPGKSIDTLQSEGWVVSKGGIYVLASEHDAAHVHWGGNWRMPTAQELEDLWSDYYSYSKRKCDWTWTTRNGVSGCIVSGRGAYVSNSIFLPAAGYGLGTMLNNTRPSGYYWSSVPYPGRGYARAMSITSNSQFEYYYGRGHGMSVRPVQDSSK